MDNPKPFIEERWIMQEIFDFLNKMTMEINLMVSQQEGLTRKIPGFSSVTNSLEARLWRSSYGKAVSSGI